MTIVRRTRKFPRCIGRGPSIVPTELANGGRFDRRNARRPPNGQRFETTDQVSQRGTLCGQWSDALYWRIVPIGKHSRDLLAARHSIARQAPAKKLARRQSSQNWFEILKGSVRLASVRIGYIIDETTNQRRHVHHQAVPISM